MPLLKSSKFCDFSKNAQRNETPKSYENCELSILSTRQLFKENKLDELIITYDKIIDYKKSAVANNHLYGNDLYKYYSNISFIYHSKRDFISAIEYAKKCIESNPKWYKGYYRIAKAYEGLANDEKAKKYYDLMRLMIEQTAETTSSSFAGEDHKKVLNDANNLFVNMLKEWLITNGGEFGDIATEYYDVDYRGMAVAKPIKEDTNIMKIPLKCLISLEEAKKCQWNKLLTEAKMTYNSPHTYMALELLDIKANPEHFKYPYIKCLPKYFNNVPINFSDEELSNLKGSYALVKIKQKKQFLRLEYDNIISGLEKSATVFPYTYDEFVWARTAIITRVYAIEREITADSVTATIVKDTILAPFADMANHEIPANTHWTFDKESNAFVVKSAKFLQKGDKLYESYGQKCNYRYFVNYGFTVPNNKFEEVCFTINNLISAIIQTGAYETNDKFLNYLNTSPEIFQIGYDINNEQIKILMNLCRQKSQLEASPKQKEIEALQLIVDCMSKALSNFDTTLEEDLHLMSMMTYNFNVTNCFNQKIGEKKLFKFYIHYFKTLISLLQSPKQNHKTIFKNLKKFLKSDNNTEKYTADFIQFAHGLPL